VRHKSKGRLVGDTTGDIKQDLKPGQLASIGAVAMAWNSIESFVDAALLTVLGTPARVGFDVIACIGAFDAKVALIKRIGELRLGISEELCSAVFKAVDDALASAKEWKGYRDDVIHCQLINASEALGLLVKRDAQFEVLLSQKALDGLYNRLISVRESLNKG